MGKIDLLHLQQKSNDFVYFISASLNFPLDLATKIKAFPLFQESFFLSARFQKQLVI